MHRRIMFRGQRGVIAIVFAVTLMVMMAMIGMALDLSRLYNRKLELQHVARAAALAAARKLNGTAAGIESARQAAALAAAAASYDYNRSHPSWSDNALQFSTLRPPGGNWTDATSAAAAPQQVFYVRVDTSALDDNLNSVSTLLMHLVDKDKYSDTRIGEVAMAGRASLNITPIGICALSNTPASSRTNPTAPANVELIEYGFRRGVSYDLMKLNGSGTTAESFLVDPLAAAGATAQLTAGTIDRAGPFICTGSVWIPTLTGGDINLIRPFPLSTFYDQLNSRFNQYNGNKCDPRGAPPDYNIKPYPYTSISWMLTAPSAQGATSTTDGGRLLTVADVVPAPTANTAGSWGPLWSYAKAVPYSQYKPGVAEPANGYSTFATSYWQSLYAPGQPKAISAYPNIAPSDKPYMTAGASYHLSPTGTGAPFATRHRRVLYLPLLSCPVPAGASTKGSVIGVGKFFMTVPATATTLYAEFAGAVQEQSISGNVELF